MASNHPNKQGFTIIEAALVLAIAGLIFAAVFIGLPALRRAQRDLQRKQEVDLVYAAIQRYYANNHKLPYTMSRSKFGEYIVEVKLDRNFVNRYIDSQCILDDERSQNTHFSSLHFKQCGADFTSPFGVPYTLYAPSNDMGKINYSTYALGTYKGENVIRIDAYADCGKWAGQKKYKYDPNDFSVEITLESGARYCVDNSSTGSKGKSN